MTMSTIDNCHEMPELRGHFFKKQCDAQLFTMSLAGLGNIQGEKLVSITDEKLTPKENNGQD